MLARQKIFHRVTEAFDADAQRMPANLRPTPQSVFVQIVSRRPFLQRQMQINDAPPTHPRSPLWQSARPLPPLLAIKLIQIFESVLLAYRFPSMHVIKQFDHDRIARIWIARGCPILAPSLRKGGGG